MSGHVLLASDLFAIACGGKNEGRWECHWCSAPCGEMWPHDDPPPLPGQRRTQPARRPGNPWICLGCWLFRRRAVDFACLGGGRADRRSAATMSLYVVEGGVWAADPTPEGHKALYEALLAPPRRFVLALLEGAGPNRLQLMEANDYVEVKADTPLAFTVNGTPFRYTVYELEEALRSGPEGREPGVRELLRLLGPYKLKEPDDKRTVGRPTKDKSEAGKAMRRAEEMSRMIAKSGGR